jgi:hypothetical protein
MESKNFSSQASYDDYLLLYKAVTTLFPKPTEDVLTALTALTIHAWDGLKKPHDEQVFGEAMALCYNGIPHK